jgi:Carbohydrate/starch-binding module (family 21)
MKNLFILVLASLLSWSAMAADEIKLLRSKSTVSTKYGMSYQGIRFEALVKNLDYAKQVYVHIKRPDGSWADVPLAYQRPADTGREVWAGDYVDQNSNTPVPSFQTFDLEFALRYKVNGTEYWDNNNGANYKQAKDSGSLLFGVNVLNRIYDYSGTAYSYGGRYTGTLTLKNLGPAKQVKIVYTTDGWKTSNTAWANYESYFWAGSYSGAPNPNQYGTEEWSYALYVNTASQIEYAIGYMVNGTTYWDNNFGRNYKFALKPYGY